MKVGYKYSLILHLIMVLLCIVSFPSFKTFPTEDTIITLETFPITDKTNIQQTKGESSQRKSPPRLQEVKPYKKPLKIQEEIKSKAEEQPAKKTPAKKSTDNTPKAIDNTPELPAQKETSPTAETTGEAVQHTSEAPKEETTPSTAKKEHPPIEDKAVQDFDSLFKDLAAQEELENNLSDAEKGANKSKYNDSLPLSLSEKDAIKSQIVKCWSIPAGGREVKNMFVIITANVDEDGTIKDIAIKERSGYTQDNEKFYEVFVESAIRALQKCSPLQGLPIEKHGSWKALELRFDPQELIY
jgi:hypothetical protein